MADIIDLGYSLFQVPSTYVKAYRDVDHTGTLRVERETHPHTIREAYELAEEWSGGYDVVIVSKSRALMGAPAQVLMVYVEGAKLVKEANGA